MWLQLFRVVYMQSIQTENLLSLVVETMLRPMLIYGWWIQRQTALVPIVTPADVEQIGILRNVEIDELTSNNFIFTNNDVVVFNNNLGDQSVARCRFLW